MMGPGMMSIRADASTVKAGNVTFDVTNWSRSIVHEMLVIAVDSPDAALPYDYGKQQVIEDQVKMLGETDELQPNASKTLTLDLPAGNYLLICNVPGHYGSGCKHRSPSPNSLHCRGGASGRPSLDPDQGAPAADSLWFSLG